MNWLSLYMFLSDACANRVLQTAHPDCSISGMGLMDLNAKVLQLFDRITRNMAPIVEMNPEEVYIAIPMALPASFAEQAKKVAEAAVSAFKAAGKPIAKGEAQDFPLDDLLSRLREKYTTVLINGTSAVAMATALEFCEAELMKVAGTYCKDQRRKQIGKNDLKWAVEHDDNLSSIFE